MRIADWIAARSRAQQTDSAILAWAWATVDLERALDETGIKPERWNHVEDALVGARGLRLRESEPALILLEPSTEGRLAGWLARHGEGEAVVYRLAEAPGVGSTTIALRGSGRLDPSAGRLAGGQLVVLVSPW
jgi:hypothetical protein